MYRKVLAASLLALCMAASHPAITLRVQVARATLDPLDSISFRLVLDNRTDDRYPLRFSSPNEERLSLRRDGKVVWHSIRVYRTGTKMPGHVRSLLPGTTTLLTYIWNGILDDGTAPRRGEYELRARVLAEHLHLLATQAVRFTQPLPLAALTRIHSGVAVTVTGILSLDAQHLTDASGEIPLVRKLLVRVRPGDTVTARGYVVRENHKLSFSVESVAPSRLHSTPAPSPAASPSPHRFR